MRTSSKETMEAVVRTAAAFPVESAPACASGLRTAFGVHAGMDGAKLMQVITLVLWLGCSVVSVLGLTMPYTRPLLPKVQPEPMQVEMLKVELTSDPKPEPDPPAVVNSIAPPPPAEAVSQPQLPEPLTVALPSAAIAFVDLVEGPARIVAATQASDSTLAVSNRAVASVSQPVQSLTFGHGAGRQPAPEYPWRAQSEGQEGVVNVRFTVAANGRVLAAAAVNPSPWPMLNDSAVRTIRRRWRFAPGSPRAYEVVIRFVLPKGRS